MAKKQTSTWESWPLKKLQDEAYKYGVQGRRFTNKQNLIHRMRQTYWAQVQADANRR